MKLSQKEFNARVKYNTELFKAQAKSNNFTPSMYYLWDHIPRELSTLQYAGMIHDIYAAAVTGTLAISDKKKHDSILMKKGKIIEVELKTSYINTKDVFKSKGDTIYVHGNKPIHLALRARFGGNPPEDDMLVYLVCCDTSGKWDTEVIGVWQIDGPTAIDLLKRDKNNITLKRFIEFGKRKNVKVNTIGWNRYVKTMLKRLPIKRIERASYNYVRKT